MSTSQATYIAAYQTAERMTAYRIVRLFGGGGADYVHQTL